MQCSAMGLGSNVAFGEAYLGVAPGNLYDIVLFEARRCSIRKHDGSPYCSEQYWHLALLFPSKQVCLLLSQQW